MQPAPEYPAPYQINTRIWRPERSRILGRRTTLGDIPGPTWTARAAWGSTGSRGMVGRSRITNGVASPHQASDIRSQASNLAAISPDNALAFALQSAVDTFGRIGCGQANGQGVSR